MNKFITKLAKLTLGLAMAAGVGVAAFSSKDDAKIVEATDATMAAGSNSSTARVNNKSAIKCGSGSKAGVMTITVGAGATSLSFYAGGWNNDTGRQINFTVPSGVTISSGNFTVANESGFSGSGSSFTVSDESIHLKTFTLSGVTSNATITLTAKNASKNRYIVWGATYTSGSSAQLSIDSSKYLAYVGNDFELNATASGYTPSSWTWSANPAGIVSIDSDEGYAVVTPEAAGTTTITVSAPNGAAAMTQTCNVTVTSASGADSSHPLTIDDAILIANYTGGTTTSSSYYMEGVVDSLYNNKYPMLQGTSDDLEVYKDCSSTVFAGDTIRVHGPIVMYNSTQPEFTNASTVEVINIPVDSVSASLSTPIITGVTGGDLSDYLSVTVNGTNSRTATNTEWKVTNSSNSAVISVESDGKTFTSSSTVGTTTLTIASVADNTKTTTLEVTLYDASLPVLQSVTVSGTPSKATQYVGQTFDWTGLTFTPVYSPVKEPLESITGANIEWNDLVAGQNPTGTYTGDNDVNVVVTVTSVSVEADGVYAVFVSGDMSTKTYDEEASWNYAGLVVKVTYKSDHDTQVAPTSTITWSASNTPKQLGVGSGKSVNVTATVDGVSSSAYGITGITINEHEVDKYGEYTGAITAGQYVIVAADRTTALTASISSNRFTNTSMTISSGIIEDPSASVVWTIEQVSGTNYWSIYNSSTGKYAGGTTSRNQGALLDSIVDLSKWTITYNNGYVFENYGRTQASSYSANAYLRQNDTESNGWATYTSGTGKAPTLYKLNNLPKAWASFNYVDDIPDKTSYVVGETFDPTGLEIHAVYTEPLIYPEEDITDDIVWDALVEGTQATGTWDGHVVEITGLTISSFTPVTYTKLTSLDQLAVGSEVIIGGYKTSATTYYALSDFDGSKYFTAATTTGTDSTLSTTSDTLIFTVEADRNGYYFKNGNNYIKRNSGDSGFGSKDSNACWTITFGEEGAVTMTNGDSGNTAFQFNDSQPRFKNYSGTQKSISIYVKTTPSEIDILKTYVSRYLLLENETLAQIPSGQTGDAGTDCLGSTGPYMTAKAALNSGEFSSHKSDFISSNDSIIANARLRYESWASAYGDSTPYQTTVSSGARLFGSIFTESNNTVAIIVIISMVSVTAIGGYFFIHKRKENI